MKHRKDYCVSCGYKLADGVNWRKTALTRKCTPCISADRAAWYEENKHEVQSRNKKYRDSNTALIMYQRIKGKAKKYGIPFDLELSDIIIPEVCPALNIKLVTGYASPYNPSLDRIDPTKGYVKGNVAVISKRANTIKNDATATELRQVADFVDEILVSRYGDN